MNSSLRSGLLLSLLLGAYASPSVYAAPAPEIESSRESRARLSRFELDLLDNTIRDAKGNRVRLSASKPEAPSLWSQLDLSDNNIPGTSTAKAYETMNLTAPVKPVIVAVIDSGVDIKHPDLQGMIWVNEAEANGIPGVDDDGDGYVDDMNGWNFIGNKDGTNLGSSNLEFTREFARMKKIAATRSLSTREAAYLAELDALYTSEKTNADQILAKYTKLEIDYLAALKLLKEAGLAEETLDAVKNFTAKSSEEEAAKTTLLSVLAKNRNAGVLKEIVEAYTAKVNFHLNLDFNPSSIIGDNPNKLYEKYYGNADVRGIGSEHGTHCSGIIGALRNNGIGAQGQSNFLKIMPIRAVPDGDERDKDIANAIRFAVDHGANIISMSFGKQYSPGKAAVDAAVAYAGRKGVLLVHAAGNDSADVDVAKNFPTAKFRNRKKATNWIEVGASSISPDENLPADFSNYGQHAVDLFAPGKDIYSTTPDGTYAVYSGTSMATPEVAGIAALILSQHPELTGQQLKKVLTTTATTFPTLLVNQPLDGAGAPKKVPFSTLSSTGGVVNALRALQAL